MNENTSIDHTNIGMRLSDMPGARSLKMVTMKLIDPTVVDRPVKTMPRPQKSMFRPGEYVPADERRVPEPPAVGHGADEDAAEHEQPAEQEHPVAEGVHPGERHVAGADLQRDQVVPEPGQHRRVEQEDHHHAVHGEQLVVELRTEHLAVGGGQLRPHQQGHQAGGEKEEEAGVDVAHADALVVDGRQEPGDARGVLPQLEELLLLDRRGRAFGDGQLLQPLEVGDDRGEVVGRQRGRRHEVPRFDLVGLGDPAGQVGAVVGHSQRPDRGAGAEVAQVGADGGRRLACPAPRGSRRMPRG